MLRKEGSGELKAKDARQLSLQHQVSRRASSSGRLGQLKEELNSTAAGPDLTGIFDVNRSYAEHCGRYAYVCI